MARRRRTPNPEVHETPIVTEEVPVAEAEPVSPDSAESEAVAVELEVEEPVAEEGSSEQEPEQVEEEGPDFGEGLQGRLRQALYRRGRAVIEWLDLAHQELSPEAVHQLRVSSRRLEAALELFAGLVGRAPVRKIRRQLKRHRRALGALRDLQRQLGWLSDEPLRDECLTEKAAQLPATVRRATKKVRSSSVSRLEKRLEHLDALLAGLLEEADQEEQVREIFSRHLWESLLSAMAFETLPPLDGSRMGVNHGFDQVRFLTPVKTGSRVRTRFVLADVKARPSGWVQITHDVTVEIDGSVKPALTARWLTLTFIEPEA